MEPLKGLILSGGKGTRLRPITHTSAKQLVPVANKPVLFYGIEAMAEAGIEEIGIIIAPETGDGDRTRPPATARASACAITYIVQDEPLGLAHAVLTAEPFLGDSPFVMYLGDNLLQGGIADLVAAFREHEPDALILLTPVPDPENYGVAELAPAPAGEVGACVRLVEKPAQPATDLALVGVYMFTAAIHDAARAIEPSARGELEITDAIQHLVDGGLRVEPHIVRGWWKDTGRLEDMLEANRLILDNLIERDRRRADRLAGRRARRDRGGRAAGAHDRARPGDHRRRRAADATATSARTRRSASAARSTAPRSSTRSCWRAGQNTFVPRRFCRSHQGRRCHSVRRNESILAPAVHYRAACPIPR